MPKKYDFCGWATKNDIKCDDGRTIRKGAFSEQNGAKVPLVFQHNHNSIDNVIGHAILEERDQGMWAYLFFNPTDAGQRAKMCVEHGDLDSLSIWANRLTQGPKGDVLHGVIRELSLVLSGANSGAKIEYPTLAHSGDTVYDEALFFGFGESMILEGGEYVAHSATEPKQDPEPKKDPEPKQDPEPKKDPEPKQDPEPKPSNNDDPMEKVRAAVASMSAEQKDALYTLVGLAGQSAGKNAGGDGGDAVQHSAEIQNGGIDIMQINAFDKATQVGVRRLPTKDQNGVIAHDAMGGTVAIHDALSDEQIQTIFTEARRGTLKDAFLAHAQDYGIENIEYLFPDARNVQMPPDFISREMTWVTKVMNGTHHSPFSRVKSIHADITADEARARGYIKGNLKKEEVFTLLRRTTTPQTIYKKQKLDKDDIRDIVDFDVVAWIKTEMRMMLNEEIARAILIGDGRPTDSEDKIQEMFVRPIYKDTASDLYAMQRFVTVASDASEDDVAKAFIRAAIKNRKDYKGSGTPTLFTTEDMLTNMLLLEDGIGHSLYKTEQELATKLRVKEIVTVPVMEGTVRETDSGDSYPLLGIIVNLNDYNVGADKGGAVEMFEDFDIDYNQEKYLIETRISGALTKPKSAIILELKTNGGTSSGTSTPTQDPSEP